MIYHLIIRPILAILSGPLGAVGIDVDDDQSPALLYICFVPILVVLVVMVWSLAVLRGSLDGQ